jgi:hypothetical protein
MSVVLAEEGILVPPATLSFLPNDRETALAKLNNADPEMFQAAYESLEQRAAEIDQLVADHFEALAGHLLVIGITPAAISAESNDQRDTAS